jgi:hypothetical protein
MTEEFKSPIGDATGFDSIQETLRFLLRVHTLVIGSVIYLVVQHVLYYRKTVSASIIGSLFSENRAL